MPTIHTPFIYIILRSSNFIVTLANMPVSCNIAHNLLYGGMDDLQLRDRCMQHLIDVVRVDNIVGSKISRTEESILN